MTLHHNEHNASNQGADKPAFTLPRDPSKAIEETIRNIERLYSVYERETDALIASDTREFLDLQNEKLTVANDYQNSVDEIIKRTDDMQDVSPHLKEKLQQMQEEFSVLAKKNLEAISRMKNTTARLGDTIRSAVKDVARKQRAHSYGEDGQLDDDSKKSVSMGVIETA